MVSTALAFCFGGGRQDTSEHQEENTQAEFLVGWKEIASYVGRGVRTVQRWNNELGLPVVRQPDGPVRARRSKVDAWLHSLPTKPAKSNGPGGVR